MIHVSLHGKIGKDKFGKFQRTHCIFQDITERKQIDEALKKNHETLEKKVKERTAKLNDMNVVLRVLLKKGMLIKRRLRRKLVQITIL